MRSLVCALTIASLAAPIVAHAGFPLTFQCGDTEVSIEITDRYLDTAQEIRFTMPLLSWADDNGVLRVPAGTFVLGDKRAWYIVNGKRIECRKTSK
jgi:hypothetical protein